MEQLIKNIEQWAIDRGIDKKGTVEGQAIKTAEEMAELIIGISKNDTIKIMDSIGDVFVTLVIGSMLEDKNKDWTKVYEEYVETPYISRNKMIATGAKLIFVLTRDCDYAFVRDEMITLLITVARMYGTTFKECVQLAYDEIKNRKGKMINGQFVKESDL